MTFLAATVGTLAAVGTAAAVGAAFRLPPRRLAAAVPATPVPPRGGVATAGLVLGSTAAVVEPLAGLAAALFVLLVPRVRRRRAAARRAAALVADLPGVVDLLALAVGAGLTVPQAMQAVVARASGPLVDELRVAEIEAARGRRWVEVLDELPSRAGEAVRPLTAALAACERYGAPVAEALDRLAVEAREQQRRRAEQAARRVPVLLLFPLVLCILPAFALLAVAPLLADAVAALRL